MHFGRLKPHASLPQSEKEVTPVGDRDMRGLWVKTTDPQKARGDECNRQEMHMDEESEPGPLEIELEAPPQSS